MGDHSIFTLDRCCYDGITILGKGGLLYMRFEIEWLYLT